MENPYPEKIIDECTGQEFEDKEHKAWRAGAMAEREVGRYNAVSLRERPSISNRMVQSPERGVRYSAKKA